MSNSPSRSRGAFSAPGVCIVASLTRKEGWAERRETFGCVRSTRGARHNAARQALARRLASHDAGRSPLGAPPRRFWASGPRFRLLGRPSSYNGGQLPSGSVQRAPRSQVVVPGGRGPGPPGANGYKPPPQDAIPRSARISHKLLKQITLLEDGRGRPHSRLHSRSGRRDASAHAPITRKGRSDTGSTAASGLKKRAALLWHGKSLWCRQCFASQIAASERETRFDRP